MDWILPLVIEASLFLKQYSEKSWCPILKQNPSNLTSTLQHYYSIKDNNSKIMDSKLELEENYRWTPAPKHPTES